jgi:peptidoglycan/xylan/chitin deacetylase (PgdA/CDA1 family)
MGGFETQFARAGKRGGALASRGLRSLFGSRAAGRFGILYYHRVCPPAPGGPPLAVHPDRFAEQVGGLQARGFRFAALEDVVAASVAGEPVPARTVVVTFDDGYRSVHEHAWPTLRRLGVPATIFLATGFVGSGAPFPFDPWAVSHRDAADPVTWAPLGWDQCADMIADGLIRIGSHTSTHADFRGRPADFERDVRTSLDEIEHGLGVAATTFSYPYGYTREGFVDDELVDALLRCGLRCAVTTDIDLVAPTDPPLRWGRIEAAASDSSADLAAKLDGWWAWMEAPRRLYHRLT